MNFFRWLDNLILRILRREREDVENWMPTQEEIDEQLHLDNFK